MKATDPLRRRLTRFLHSAALALGMVVAAQAVEPPSPPKIAFQPTGMWIWDNWFVHDDNQWHAFYLQLPKAVGSDRRWKNNDFYKHVGHATSTDLVQWKDEGPALCALSGTWNDRHIATGSILKHEGKWQMFFTGRGTQGDGVGVALSDDMMTWKTEPAPLFPLIDTFATEGREPFKSTWKGQEHPWIGISDPYILPEAQEGWFYMVLCARVLDQPIAESGCLAMVRSRDLRHWEESGIIAWPRCFERMETPQLWQRGQHWYLAFGGCLEAGWIKEHANALPAAIRGRRSHENYYYLLPKLGAAAQEENLHPIETPRGCYIMKVLTRQPGDAEDVAIFTQTVNGESGMSALHRVSYAANGEMRVEAE